MKYRKLKRNVKKRYYKKKKMQYVKKPIQKATISKAIRNENIHYFKRTIEFEDIAVLPMGGSPVDQFYAYHFKLDQLLSNDVTDFVNLFEFYRILKVVIHFKAIGVQMMTTGVNADSNASFCPLVCYAIDYNDRTIDYSTGNELLAYTKSGQFKMTRDKKITIYPCTASPVFRTSVLSTAYVENPRNLWINSKYTDVEYYGLKIFIPGGEFANVFRMTPVVTFHLAFKNPKTKLT